MNNPRVSIVIPVYNTEQYLRECLDSILAQTYNDWECILVNDGSKDNSGNICDAYKEKDHRFKVIHQNNGGAASARNAGIESAIGTWLCFIDSDDTISSDFFDEDELEQQTDLILKPVHLSTNGTSETYQGEGIIRGKDLKDFYSQYLPRYVFLTPWAKLIRRSIIADHNIRYNTAYKLGEDTLFVHACLRFVQSLIVSHNGYYIWKPFEGGKYFFPFTTARHYMHDFAKEFFALDVKCPQLAKDMLIWYSSFTTDFNAQNKIDWYTDPIINKLYCHALSLFPVFMRMKILLYRTISFFRK